MNYGKGITIFMIAFIAFIASMVYYAFTKNADLVRDDYYENELLYDQQKEEQKNYASLSEKISINKEERGIVFYFPKNTNDYKGKINFYRPDQKKFDREFDLEVDKNYEQVLEYKNFKEGYYDVYIEYTSQGKGYLFQDKIQF